MGVHQDGRWYGDNRAVFATSEAGNRDDGIVIHLRRFRRAIEERVVFHVFDRESFAREIVEFLVHVPSREAIVLIVDPNRLFFVVYSVDGELRSGTESDHCLVPFVAGEIEPAGPAVVGAARGLVVFEPEGEVNLYEAVRFASRRPADRDIRSNAKSEEEERDREEKCFEGRHFCFLKFDENYYYT